MSAKQRDATRENGLVSDATLFLIKSLGMAFGYTESAATLVYDQTASLFGHKSPAKGLFTGGLRKQYGLNKGEVQARIAQLESVISELYSKIGKLGALRGDETNLFAEKEVREIASQIKSHETEITRYKNYMAELDAAAQQNVPVKKQVAKTAIETDGRVSRRIKTGIEKCLKNARFPLRSEALLFEKTLNDLLSEEPAIQRLAVSELGRLGKKSVGPLLKEALRSSDTQLQAEIINTLILLEDGDVFAICRDFLQHSQPAIRAICVRGLYKQGPAQAVPLLITALRDADPGVRTAAAIFLGWLEAHTAVISLLQACRDSDKNVRKNAVMALANIRDEAAVLPMIRLLDSDDRELQKQLVAAIAKIAGEVPPFDWHQNKKQREQALVAIRDWWLAKKHSENSEASGFDQKQQADKNAAMPEGVISHEKNLKENGTS